MLYGFSVVMGNSYALALILYALVFKLVFLPFAIKQQKNQVKMANLTPKIELIKAKYRGRNDRTTMQKMQQEIMELQQREGVSMFGGCLPMLIQLPIIIFLYNVIRSPLTHICGIKGDAQTALKGNFANFYNANPTLIAEGSDAAKMADALMADQIKAVSVIQQNSGFNFLEGVATNGRPIPDMSLFGLDLGHVPYELFDNWGLWWLLFIPVLAAGLQWLSMFFTKMWNGNANQVAGSDAQAQASMKMMDIIFPLMTLWIAFSFTSLMGLYWVFQSVLAILQTFIISHAMPLPKFTEEQLKQMRREQKAVEKAQKKALKNQKYRSLHYIDEDDYDELPEVKNNNEQTKNTGAGMLNGNDLPNIKD